MIWDNEAGGLMALRGMGIVCGRGVVVVVVVVVWGGGLVFVGWRIMLVDGGGGGVFGLVLVDLFGECEGGHSRVRADRLEETDGRLGSDRIGWCGERGRAGMGVWQLSRKIFEMWLVQCERVSMT